MATKSRHYTPAEKSLFLQILGKYKHVVECKKSNVNTLREKEAAWKEICDEYNNSSLITQDIRIKFKYNRNVQQLKKLWTNLKQVQRDILTRKKQARFATGGGSETPSTEIDPDIAAITPNLMATAPVLFTSNMGDEEIENMERNVLQNINMTDTEVLMKETETDTPQKVIANIEIEYEDDTLPAKEIITIQDENKNSRKTKKRTLSPETEMDLKILRIRNIIEKEQQIAQVQLQHEKIITAMKETHLKEMNQLELHASQAKAKLAELLLEKENNAYIAK